MKHTDLCNHTYCAAIDSTKRLYELVISAGGRSCPGVTIYTSEFYAVYPELIFDSLLAHRDCLQYLDLDFEKNVDLSKLFDPTTTWFKIDDEWWPNLPYQRELPSPPETLAEVLQGKSFREFTRLKHRDDISLADGLPSNLESLRIYGYKKGDPLVYMQDLKMDYHIAKLMEEKETKLPHLMRVEGVEEYIPNAEVVPDAGDNPHLLWERKYLEEDWVELALPQPCSAASCS
ncbi:hypothetical protein BDW74DRAFT_174436 [Aspergillus multicolor]|uniref:uncharacterized protein n=1 Tax=Aspergillus multicolor TaxID=41759 RepID=UPI003CCE0AFF